MEDANMCISYICSYASCSCDLDLNPMTFMYELDLGILKLYVCTKNEVSRSRLSEVRARTGQIHRRDPTHYHVTKLFGLHLKDRDAN